MIRNFCGTFWKSVIWFTKFYFIFFFLSIYKDHISPVSLELWLQSCDEFWPSDSESAILCFQYDTHAHTNGILFHSSPFFVQPKQYLLGCGCYKIVELPIAWDHKNRDIPPPHRAWEKKMRKEGFWRALLFLLFFSQWSKDTSKSLSCSEITFWLLILLF